MSLVVLLAVRFAAFGFLFTLLLAEVWRRFASLWWPQRKRIPLTTALALALAAGVLSSFFTLLLFNLFPHGTLSLPIMTLPSTLIFPLGAIVFYERVLAVREGSNPPSQRTGDDAARR